MSAAMANFFNTMLISLESIMLFILASGFFQRKRNIVFTCISFFVVLAIDCIIIFLFGFNVALKYGLLLLSMALWTFAIYKTSLIKCFFPAAFLLAYLTLMDNVVIALLGMTMGKSTQELWRTPESYYMVCYLEL